VNVFVTVGTTAFDPLVEAVDRGGHAGHALLQIGDGEYVPANARWFRFEPGIRRHVEAADVVVCHAGAGSVFGLLESGIVPLVVPNTVRRDKHQLEIARWLTRNRYAVVAMDPMDVNATLDGFPAARERCVPFAERRFFEQATLNRLVRARMGIDG